MKQIHPETGICFFRAQAPVLLSALLRDADFSPLTVDTSALDEWFEYGCIYINGKRQREDIELEAEQVVRLHTRRKHYVNQSLKDLVVIDDPEFLVLDKPAGVPTHPTLDNYVENAKILLERELGQTLYTTHRLDIPTEGLLIIAKTPAAQKLFNKMFSLGRVKKIYRSLNEARVADGPLTHYMDPESRLPKILSAEVNEDWWTCRLNVNRSGEQDGVFWHELELFTGKTHQIRAQMSFMGAPVLGDTSYGAAKKYVHERIALECYELSFTFRSRTFTIARPVSIVAPPPLLTAKFT
jgi:23S rRNA pseudouridine1911/1915/1917 synthase